MSDRRLTGGRPDEAAAKYLAACLLCGVLAGICVAQRHFAIALVQLSLAVFNGVSAISCARGPR
jgi:hypothetical protein